MTELEWLRFIYDICRLNAEENSWVTQAEFPLSIRERYVAYGREKAYRHIEEYIKDRIEVLNNARND